MSGSSKTLQALGLGLVAMIFGAAYPLILPRFVAGVGTRVRSRPALTTATAAGALEADFLADGRVAREPTGPAGQRLQLALPRPGGAEHKKSPAVVRPTISAQVVW